MIIFAVSVSMIGIGLFEGLGKGNSIAGRALGFATFGLGTVCVACLPSI